MIPSPAATNLLRRIGTLAAGGRRWPWLVTVLLALAVSLFEAFGAVLVFALLALVTEGNGETTLPVVGDVRRLFAGDDPSSASLGIAAFVAGFFLLRAIVVLVAAYAQGRVTQAAGARLAIRLHEGYIRIPYELHLTLNSSRQIRNVQETVQRIVTDVFMQGTRGVTEVIVILGLVTVLVFSSPLATGLAIALIGPTVLVLNRSVHPRLETLGRQAQDLYQETLRSLQESLGGLREIRVTRTEHYFTGEFAELRTELARNRYRRVLLNDLPSVALETILVLFIAGFLALTVARGDRAVEALPVLGMFAYVGLRLKPSITQVVQGLNALRYAGAAIEDVHAELVAMSKWSVPEREPGTRLGFDDAIAVRSVRYRYPGADTDALRDVDLTIRRGQSVGFVGPTGGGKSTLIDVILGLLPPTSGLVTVDGHDVRTHRTGWLATVGLVPQTIFLLDASIRANVAFGVPEGAIDDTAVWSALRTAQLEDFVSDLPDGLDTHVGERGVRVSGGQRQRLVIARALYREPDVLILDEGTSSLDNQTEARLIDDLEAARMGRTLIVVAHRLSTVEQCDEIHVIEGGTVTASGDYDSLRSGNEAFRQLLAASSQRQPDHLPPSLP